MKDSVTYQAIVAEGRAEGEEKGRAEGRAEEVKRLLLQLGEERWGRPSTSIRTTIRAIPDLARLETLASRLLKASSWDELLAMPRHNGG